MSGRVEGERTKDVALRDGSVRVVVRFDAGHEDWADYVLRRAAAYLPAVEAYLDVPMQSAAKPMLRDAGDPPVIRIVGRDRVMLGTRWIGGYNNTAGFTDGERAIFLEYGISRVDDPALVLHELGHFWFRDGSLINGRGVPWFNEGMVSLLPLAIADSGLLDLTTAERRGIERHFGQHVLPSSTTEDLPLEHDFRQKSGGMLRFFYAKTFKTQLVLYRELGPASFRTMASVAARKRPRTTSDVLEILDEVHAEDWRTTLRGWVLPGAYAKPFTPEAVVR